MAFEALRSEMSLDKSEYGRAIREASKETATFGAVASDSFEEASDGAEEAGDEAQDAASGFNRFGNAIRDAVLPAQLFASRADEAGDEASEAGRSAFGAATGFTALRFSTSGAAFSMGVFSAATSSTIIALSGLAFILGAVLLALAPLVIGATAVAAAFGLIIGTGLFAGMKKLSKAFKKVKKQITPLIKEFGKQFVPFLKETILMLPGLVKSLLDAVGGMDVFLNALRTLRNVAFKVLPKLVRWFFDLGRWALPILTDIGAFIMAKVVPAVKTLVRWGKQIWKVVGRWVKEFQQATKKGTKLRTKIDKLVKAAKRFWTNLQPVIKALKPLVRQLIRLAPVIAKVALDIGRLAINIGTKLLPYLVPIINLATKLVRWFNSLSYSTKRLILVAGGLFLALGPIITILGTLGSALTTIGSIILTVVTFFNPITLAIIALGVAIGGLAYLIYKNWEKIKSWTKGLYNSFTGWLEDMVKTAKNLGSAIANGLVKMFNAALPDSLGLPSITIPQVGFEIPGLSIAGHQVYKAQSVAVGPFGPFGGQSVPIPQLNTGGYIRDAGLAMLHAGERVLTAAQVDRRGGSGSGPTGPMEVIVTLDTDDEALKTWVDDRADVQVKQNVDSALKQAKRRGTFQ
jgi:hypothetical protein